MPANSTLEKNTYIGYNQVKGGVESGGKEQSTGLEREFKRNRVALFQLVSKESNGISESEKKIQTKIIRFLKNKKNFLNSYTSKQVKTLYIMTIEKIL